MSCCWVEEGRRILLQRSFFCLVGFKYHSLGVAFPFPPDLLSLLSRSGGVSPRRFSPGAEIVSVVGFDSSGFADQLRRGANERRSSGGGTGVRSFDPLLLSLGWLLRRRLRVCLPVCLPGDWWWWKDASLPNPPPSPLPWLATLAAPLSSLAVLRSLVVGDPLYCAHTNNYTPYLFIRLLPLPLLSSAAAARIDNEDGYFRF